MHLDYLIFDCTDEEDGSCSFDAMASVAADRLPALLREVEAVLAWAHRGFGAPAGEQVEREWDFELQASGGHDVELAVAYDARRAQVTIDAASTVRVTLAFTVSGSATFAHAFREAFPAAN